MIIQLFCVFLVALSVCQSKDNKDLNLKPVIGIFTQPSRFSDVGTYPEYQYVLSPYVEYIGQTGAKAVPVQFDGSEEYIRSMMDQLNGVLFTGGGLDINIEHPIDHTELSFNIFTLNAKLILDIAIEKNDAGIEFAIWGTCQGFQLMSYIMSGLNYDVIQHLENDENTHRNGIFVKSSKLFKDMPDEMIKYASKEAPLYYYHELYVSNKTFYKYASLRNFFSPVGWGYNSTSATNPDNLFYVAAIEAFKYPFYGVQFHPEYTQFLYTNINTNREPESLQISQYLANFFTQQTRKNFQRFDNERLGQKMFFQNHKLTEIEGFNFGNGYFYTHQDFENFMKDGTNSTYEASSIFQH